MGKLLSTATKGRAERPARITVYGPDGIGKSTFASCAPNTLFLGAEDGTSEIDVFGRVVPKTWEEFKGYCAELENEAHDYKSLAIDTADWLEPLIWKWVCQNCVDDKGKKHDNIEGYGWGKGYIHAFEQWRLLFALLDRLRDKKSMNIIVLAHAKVKMFKNPVGEDYERFQLKLDDRAGALLREWSDAVLFANFETVTHEQNDRSKGISTGKRLIYVERDAGYDAKNRYGLTKPMALDWDDFIKAARAPLAPTTELLAQLEALLPRLPADKQEKASAGMKTYVHNARKLSQMVNWARALAAPAEEKKNDATG